MLSNLLVQSLLSCACSIFLVKSLLVGHFNFLVHGLNSCFLVFLGKFVLKAHTFNVRKHRSLLTIEDLFFLLALLLAGSDLIDDDLSSISACHSSPFFSFVLGVDGLQALDLHHNVKSLLLSNPVLLEQLVLIELAVSHGGDLRVKHHLVEVLDIIVIFVHLLLSFGK